MRRYTLFVLCVLAGLPAALRAQGFGIYELGSCGMGRAGTGVATPCPDGSAIFFNPAGLAGLTGWHVSLGGTMIKAFGTYTKDTTLAKLDLTNPWIPVPHVYLSYGATPKLGVGIGLFAPYGLETRWPLSFDGRFSGFDNIIRNLYIQPTAAYQLSPAVSIGAGLDIVYGHVELNQRLDLSQQVIPVPGLPPGTTFAQFGIAPGTDFASSHLEASQTQVTGAHFGVIVKVNDQLSFGGRYLMKAKIDYTGTATFTQVPTGVIVPVTVTVGTFTIPAGTSIDALLASPPLSVFTNLLPTQTVTTSITNPEQLVLGVSYKVRSDLTLSGDYQLTFWGKRFTQLPIIFSNPGTPSLVLNTSYNNSSDFRFGAEWVKDAKLKLRAGYLYNTAAAPASTVTPLLPEGPRNEVTAGAGVALAPRWSVDFAYQFIKQDDRRGRTRELSNATTAQLLALNNGLYSFSAHLFGASLAYSF
jgi:long-chain fatty acid transport protein